MHDIRFIRENPEAFDKGLARRGLSTVSPEILAFDAERRATQTSLQELQAKRNDVSRKIGEVKRTGGDADALMQEVASIKDKMTALEESERELG